MGRDDLRAIGDRDLAAILAEDRLVKDAMEQRNRDEVAETRRHLLGTAVRITASMSPGLQETVEHCNEVLENELPTEVYVAPSPHFNAFSYGSERGRVIIGFTSALLEAFNPDELRFVMGHELGHFIYGHHDIPVHALTQPGSGLRAEQALQLFAWQRYAELSADRAGLACVGDIKPTASAFFKLASGLTSDNIEFDIDAYLEQIGDIETEAAKSRESKKKSGMRSDWFASHPFSPLRVRAAQLCAQSQLLVEGGMSLEQLETEVEKLMTLMDPGYLHDKSATGEAMRRLLFAGGVLVAAADGEVEDAEYEALQAFLGEGAVPPQLNPDALRLDLVRRVEFARDHVPAPKLAQVVRDLVVIALADGHADDDELAIIREIADSVDVDRMVIERALVTATAGLD
jgi:hypothetical protein